MSKAVSDLVALTNCCEFRRMENLTEKVYECTLAVEAHMICDLLVRAGISARVDGAYLSGVGGELPLGNTVKVRVAPETAAEAREVIAEWEGEQTGDVVPPATASPRFRSPFWFFIGTLVGGTFAFVMIHSMKPSTVSGIDYDGDGRDDVTHFNFGTLSFMTTFDRNHDGISDARWDFDAQGHESDYTADDDFDGRFEWRASAEYGQISRSELDRDGDGHPEQVRRFEQGVLSRVDYLSASGRTVKREHYQAGLLDSAEYDDDGDGVFERRVRFDSYAEPKL